MRTRNTRPAADGQRAEHADAQHGPHSADGELGIEGAWQALQPADDEQGAELWPVNGGLGAEDAQCALRPLDGEHGAEDARHMLRPEDGEQGAELRSTHRADERPPGTP